MVFTAARFSEIVQFSMRASDLDAAGDHWQFVVKVKGKAYLQPIEVHRILEGSIDPIRAMQELKRRMQKKRWQTPTPTDSFRRTEKGNVMKAEDVRLQTKEFLRESGIPETCPYHIKHATITWLYRNGVTSDRIVRCIRHAHSSTT
jgi:site-specific recombinase XerD